MLPVILTVVALVVVALVVLVVVQPADFRVARSANVDAPPAAVFPLVNDFHRWDSWSPFAKTDPKMKTTYAGPPAGQGASYSWDGNMQAGAGTMTITECREHERIVIRLDFLRPFKHTNTSEFTFEPKGQGSVVTWAMTGKKNLFLKAAHLVMNVDKLLGTEFEKGLADIKAIAEGKK